MEEKMEYAEKFRINKNFNESKRRTEKKMLKIKMEAIL